MGRRGGLKSWIIEPYQQVKLGIIFLGINVLFAVLIGGVLGYYFWDVYSTMAVYFKFTEVEAAQVLAKFQIPVLICFGLLAGFVVTTILVTLNYTYAFYGPLVSIHSFIDDLIQGKDVAPLKIRGKDHLQELSTKLNQLRTVLGKDLPFNDQTILKMILDHLGKVNLGQDPGLLKIPFDSRFVILEEQLNLLTKSLDKAREKSP